MLNLHFFIIFYFFILYIIKRSPGFLHFHFQNSLFKLFLLNHLELQLEMHDHFKSMNFHLFLIFVHFHFQNSLLKCNATKPFWIIIHELNVEFMNFFKLQLINRMNLVYEKFYFM